MNRQELEEILAPLRADLLSLQGIRADVVALQGKIEELKQQYAIALGEKDAKQPDAVDTLKKMLFHPSMVGFRIFLTEDDKKIVIPLTYQTSVPDDRHHYVVSFDHSRIGLPACQKDTPKATREQWDREALVTLRSILADGSDTPYVALCLGTICHFSRNQGDMMYWHETLPRDEMWNYVWYFPLREKRGI